MKRVLLTGAFGNVGVNTLVHLCDRGYEVFAFDVQNSRNQKWATQLSRTYRFKIIWGDLRARDAIQQAVNQVRPTTIVHLAAVIAPTAYVIPEDAYDVNVNGTQNLLAAASALEVKPHFIFTSSYSIHGPRNPYRNLPPLTAETPVIPDDNYGRHKAAGEQMVRSSGLPWTILRLSTVMATAKGWGQATEFFRFAFLLPLDRRAHVIDSRDVGLALANVVANERVVERLFILGGPEDSCRITGHDFFAGIGQARGIPFPPAAFRRADPDVDASWYYEDWVDTRESQQILQYQEHTFADYLRYIRQQTKYTRPLLKLVHPLVRRRVVKESPYYEEGPIVSSERMWLLICDMFDLDPNQR